MELPIGSRLQLALWRPRRTKSASLNAADNASFGANVCAAAAHLTPAVYAKALTCAEVLSDTNLRSC